MVENFRKKQNYEELFVYVANYAYKDKIIEEIINEKRNNNHG